MEITLEEIQKKFASLPEDLQWAIMAANVDDNIIDIGNKEHLNVEQMGQLSLETYMVMFGFTPLDKFESSVKASLGLIEDKNSAIVNAVNEKILKGVREQMMGKPMAKVESAEPAKTITPPSLAEIKIGLPNLKIPELAEGEKKINIPAPSSLEQKFTSSFQSNVVKTEHTLGNISRASTGVKTMTDVKTASSGPVKAYTKDPYRMNPEE